MIFGSFPERLMMASTATTVTIAIIVTMTTRVLIAMRTTTGWIAIAGLQFAKGELVWRTYPAAGNQADRTL